LVGICTRTAFQHLEGFVHLADVIKDTYSGPTGEASNWDQPPPPPFGGGWLGWEC
jgi:hypothetical protein